MDFESGLSYDEHARAALPQQRYGREGRTWRGIEGKGTERLKKGFVTGVPAVDRALTGIEFSICWKTPRKVSCPRDRTFYHRARCV